MTLSEIQKYITRRLVEVREAKEMTQGELAKLTGISQDKISRIENGTREVSAAELWLLAKALKEPVSYFYPKL